MAAHLQRIETFDGTLNALPTRCFDEARQAARAADLALAGGATPGPLFGLPVAHKDLVETRGLRTTYGSPIFRDFVPKRDALLVERIAAAGAIRIGKTNTPEFGAGSHTFNEVFGETRNPWDVTRTCGGSSGGAAVALSAGFLPVADGSDLGGSLRNPASFCNVVGFRPSPGRVPSWPDTTPWSPFGTDGPMGRTVEDTALLLSVMAGPDGRSPIALEDPGEKFAPPLSRDLRGVRVAWSRTLGGLPVEAAVTEALEGMRPVLEELGCTVVDAEPELAEAGAIFQAWRAALMHARLGPLLDTHRSQLKDTVVWNLEAGRNLGASELLEQEAKRAELWHRFQAFFADFDFLCAPVSQVVPFPLEERWVRQIGETPMETYIDWMQSCSWITVTGHPALSVPAAFTPGGLPVGLQVVGRHRDDRGVLEFGHAFEQLAGASAKRPTLGR